MRASMLIHAGPLVAWLDRADAYTLDSDFRIYRRHGRLTVPTLMPAEA